MYRDIEACLGADVVSYAKNKHRGGSSGNKGTRYEDFFMAFKVIEAASLIIADTVAHDPFFKGQDTGFVDDLKVAHQSETSYFQLKNKATVSWTAGTHPLHIDFSYQHHLSTHLREPQPTTTLVVPTPELASSLSASMPSSIASHSSVYHFPWTETANVLVMEDETLRQRLRELSQLTTPTDDALCGTFCAVLSACIEFPNGATATQLVNKVHSMYPGQIRLLPLTEDWGSYLSPELRSALDNIDGLLYGAERGYFYWKAFGTSGVLGQSVQSEEFQSFQRAVIESQPLNFEDFEQLLP